MICSSGVGFDPVVDEQRLLFHAAGIYNGVFTMFDDLTGSVWSHLDGVSTSGVSAGRRLEVRALQTTSWAAWREAHPDTTVLDTDTGVAYRREDTLGGQTLGEDFLNSLGGISAVDARLPIGELVVGVLAGDGAAAFPANAAREHAPAQAEVGGVPVVLLGDARGQPSLAYHRALTDGRVLDFERRGGAIIDRQTGSRWTADGVAIAGPLAGVRLSFLTSFLTEWYGWAAFYPQTSIVE